MFCSNHLSGGRKMSVIVVEKIFGEGKIRFREDGWFCATDAARLFTYKVDNWLRFQDNQELVVEVAKANSNSLESRELEFNHAVSMLVQATRGRYGSTWMHPDLAVPFAMAVNPKFGYWVIQQIKHILVNERQKIEDWNVARNKTKSANKFRNAQVDVFEGRSKANFYKYSTEIWFIVGGSWKDKILRNELTAQELEILQDIERCQALLIELQQDWEELDHNFKRRDILINRVNRLRAGTGMSPIDHGVFWAKAKREYAKKKLLAEYQVG